MFAVFGSGPHDGQIGFKIKLKHPKRLLHIGGWSGDGDQRQDHVTGLDMIFDPFFVDRDITFKKMQTRVSQQGRDARCFHVHAVNMPVGGI